MPDSRPPSTDAHARARSATVVILALLLVAAATIRFQGLSDPLVSFHPLRHYRSALIARSCYYEATPATPAWAVAIARANRDIQQAGEPPLMEWLACAAYRIAGREDLVIPKGLSTVWWIAGAIAVYLIGCRLVSTNGALIATALHLFLPYAIAATRTFQPDSLMTACAIWATFALVRWRDRPTPGRLATAALLSGLALLVKPMSVFVVMPAMFALAFARVPGRRLVSDGGFWLMAGLALIPPGLYYGASFLFGSLAQDQFQTRFVPSLLITQFFWAGWSRQAHHVFGWVGLAAVVGTVIAVQPILRRLLQAIWLGYVAFAVAFTYHVPTHDYYHLPFIPIAALAAAAGVDRLCSSLRWPSGAVFALTGVACVAIAWRGAVLASPGLWLPNAVAIVADYERIGQATGHDGKVVFLDLEYGYPLMYHGQIAGDAWPGIDDLEAERLDGRPPRSAARRFAEDYAGMQPRYFVVTDFASVDAEPELQRLLATTATVVDETPRHRVYRFAAQ
jgi:4-amino-4-deoxy-L-arabinose transferase-like glycosyltransferase